MKTTVNSSVNGVTLEQMYRVIDRLNSISLTDLSMAMNQLEDRRNDLRWATDPLELMPLFDTPRLALSAYLRRLGDSLITIADWLD